MIERCRQLHDDELGVDPDMVRQLVRQSLPQYADMSLAPLGFSGSSNALFRLGDELLVRLPRQPGGSVAIEKEARWLPVVAAGLTTTVPEVVAVGQPGFGYPETWAVTRWIDGDVPPRPSAIATSRQLTDDLAQMVSELRLLTVPRSAHDDPGLSWYRGGRLAEQDHNFRQSVEACRIIDDLGLDLDRAVAIWDEALAAELTAPPLTTCWYHGDLLAENLLTQDGQLVAVIDFGGLAIGDPTVDLVAAWDVLDAAERRTFRRSVDVDDATWTKGMGWALLIAMITFPYYWHSMPARCAARRSMASTVLAEA